MFDMTAQEPVDFANRAGAEQKHVTYEDFDCSKLSGRARSFAAPFELLAHMVLNRLPDTPARNEAMTDLLAARTGALRAFVLTMTGTSQKFLEPKGT